MCPLVKEKRLSLQYYYIYILNEDDNFSGQGDNILGSGEMNFNKSR